MESNDTTARRHVALTLAMDFQRDIGNRDEKALIEIAKRFDHFLLTGANARDKTLVEADNE